MAEFERLLEPRPGERILDLGGYRSTWSGATFQDCLIDLVNIDAGEETSPPFILANGLEVREVRGNGCHLEFADNNYDIVFSNSVIEHVGSIEDQISFAKEARRVGKRLWIQTPAMSCPFEPHFLGIGIHWVPRPFRSFAARFFSLRGLLGGHSAEQIKELVDSTRLISRKRLRQMFPDCEIHTERILGIIPKSYIVTRIH